MSAKKTETENAEVRPGYGPHVTISLLKEIDRFAPSSDPAISWQLISHLTAGCAVCRKRVEQAFVQPGRCAWTGPLLSAMARLVLPPAEVKELPPMERAAVQEAEGGELGFAFLLLERAAAHWVPFNDDLRLWWGLIAANAALVQAPAATHDLVARYLALTGGTLCREEKFAEAERAVAVAVARDYARQGRGGGEPMASVVETAALVAAGLPDHERCRALVDEALALLAEHPFPDRRAEVALNVAQALGQHGELTRDGTLALLKLAVAQIDAVEPEINPRLRLATNHHLALLETEAMVAAWANGTAPQGGFVQRLAERWAGVDGLYQEGTNPEMKAQRGVIEGRILLATNPPKAAGPFGEAMTRFGELGAPATVNGVLAELLLLAARGGPPVSGTLDPPSIPPWDKGGRPRPSPGGELNRHFFQRLWEGIGQPGRKHLVIRDVLAVMAAAAPAVGEAVYSALTELVDRWTAAGSREEGRAQAAERSPGQREAERLGREAAATGYQTAEEAKRCAGLLEEALLSLDGMAPEDDPALRLRLLLMLVEVRLEQQFEEVRAEGFPVGGKLAAALRALDGLRIRLHGPFQDELRALRKALDARLLLIAGGDRGQKLLAWAVKGFYETNGFEPGALALFHLLRLVHRERPDHPDFQSAAWGWKMAEHWAFRQPVNWRVVGLLDRAYRSEGRLTEALALLMQPAAEPTIKDMLGVDYHLGVDYQLYKPLSEEGSKG